ncbi:MAG: phosphoadenosine phosphosulfate reductase family protein [Flavobacteriaceae bacterium]|nr:phosphoadenosine phosphosulfate reductase family protein [Flavobacteriaceae bacterium]
MNKITSKNITLFNTSLRHESPEEIIKFALELSEKPIVTTSFGPLSASILHASVKVKPNIQVIWCDTGYNTEATYQHLQELSEKLQLNLDIFVPKYTTAFIDNMIGRPNVDNPNHAQFSEEVKLEPFRRALQKHQPDIWISNLRKGQTKHRETLDILSFSKEGILKVSPFYYYNDQQLVDYLKTNGLPIQWDYFDPVKAMSNRECGIHLLS